MKKLFSLVALLSMGLLGFMGYASEEDAMLYIDGTYYMFTAQSIDNNRIEPIWVDGGTYHGAYKPFTFDTDNNPFALKGMNESSEYYVYLNNEEKPNSKRGQMANIYDVEVNFAAGDVLKVYDHEPFITSFGIGFTAQASTAYNKVKVLMDGITPVRGLNADDAVYQVLEGTKFEISPVGDNEIANVYLDGQSVNPVDGVYTVTASQEGDMQLIIDVVASGGNADLPAITMHSENYDLYGNEAVITLGLGSTVTGRIGVDCGRGIEMYDISPATFDSSQNAMRATYIPCQLNADGQVAVYCYDGIAIDYFDGDGCGLTTIEFADPEAIEILSLRHNSLSALDLSAMCNVASIDVGDNPFGDSPLVVGPNKPNLLILNVDIVENMDPSLSLRDYPSLVAFDAYDNKSLVACDPTQCPNLAKLSIDDTAVSSLDVSQNPELLILNVGGTDIRSLDVTNNTKLQQLFCSAMGRVDKEERISYIDISNCPDLIYFFCGNNALADVDLSHNPLLEDISLSHNYLTSIDLSHNPNLMNVAIDHNYMSFANLPSDPGWLDYKYEQYPIELPKSYLVGTPIDLSDMLLRPGTETWAIVNVISPDYQYREMGPDEFTFVDGVLTINSVVEGQVYAEFYNTELSQYPMTTTQFRVKTAEQYGANDLVFTLNVPSLDVNSTLDLSIGMAGATPKMPKTFYVDLGDGKLVEGLATTATIPDTPNFSCRKGVNGEVKVYVEQDVELTAIGFADQYVADIDLTHAKSLEYLSLTGTGMYGINLKANSRLKSLTLTGNHLGDDFTLIGETGYYNKNFLEYIDLSDNEIGEIQLMTPEIITYLDLSHNHISNLNLNDGERIETLNVSYNQLDNLRLSYQSSLKWFDGSHNRLSQIVLPETNVIERMDLSDNCFTFATLPAPGEGTGEQYCYTPQATIAIATKGMSCNLSAEYVTVAGNTTTYSWLDTDGIALVEGTDYILMEGVTQFQAPAEGKEVYCEITNAAYPDLTLLTSTMTAAGMPQYVVGEFTTPRGGQNVVLSLGGAYDGATVYIDWEGKGNISEYVLKTTYTLFDAVTTAGARVKVYSYEPESPLTIFSVNGMTMRDVDLTGMTNLVCLSITNAGISELTMPDAPNLRELFMVNNKFTDFDFAAYPQVTALSFERNLFTEVDLSPMVNLEMVNFSSNNIQSVNLGSLPNLWAIHLSSNKIEEIDLSQVPSAYQITLDNNRLKSIDVDHLSDLHVLYLDHNEFTFTTLPTPREQWTVYYYANQAPLQPEVIDGVVDLSSQSIVNGVASTYTWLSGMPWLDTETGELMGNLLVEDEDYVVEDGVTTFRVDVPDAVCIILNEVFPRAYMTTVELAVNAASLADVVAERPTIKVKDASVQVTAQPGEHVEVYTLDGKHISHGDCDTSGSCIISHLPQGVLLVKVCSMTAKITIKQ